MQFADRWICDQGWFEILTNLFTSLKDSITINRTNHINVLNRIAIASPFDVTIGDVLVYNKSFTIDCPFGTSSRMPVHFYYRCHLSLKKLGKETMKFVNDCCKEAVADCNNLGFATTINYRTLQRWNKMFSANNGRFQNPNPSSITLKGKTPRPRIFEYFPNNVADVKKLTSRA